MTKESFLTQWQRLVNRFGAKAMDSELMRLCAVEVDTMSEANFKRTVETWIGSRPHTKPPLLSEFREARIAEEKLAFQNDVRGASNFLNRRAPGEMRSHLRAVLSKEFGGVENPVEAWEVARIRKLTSDKPDGAA